MVDDTRGMRLGGWAGILFSILSLIVLPLVAVPMAPPPPLLGSDGPAVVAWFQAHRGGFLWGNYLGIAAFFPGFLQLVILAARVRRREGEGGWLGALVLTSGTFGYAVFACSLILFQVLPFLVDAAAAQALGWLASVWFALDGLAALPLVLAVGWAVLRTGALPRWVAHASWAGAALSVVMSLGGLTATPAWLAGGGPATFAGFVGFFVWTAAIGVAMIRSKPLT
jgi:hypothetical protein